MAGNEFPHVFSPFALGGLTLRNRLVALPAGTSLVTDGVPDHGDLEHVERLASGGVGLIVGGATVVHPTTTLRSRKLIEAYNDAIVPATAEKVAVAHRHGARYVTQLVHLGREFIGGESESAPVAPSPIKTVRDAYPPHELTAAEIDDIVAGWKKSATNLVAAGVDGIEVHAAHGYLVAQFMSPLTNRRTDEFGGSFENRMRFAHLVLDAISSELPTGTVLGVRLSGEEEIPGGMGIDDCVEIARDIAGRGDVAYFSVTHGTRGKYVKDSTGQDAVAVPSASKVRAATGVPTLVGQRIRDVATAEHAVKNGHADLVGMARALIADPQLPNKSREGRLREIRGCLGVNQDCRAFDPHLHCAVNAEVGRPRHRNVGSAVDQAKTVYIVGGGPAGLEAARVAAERGHRVSLFEAAPELGGSVRVAASAPHRSSLIDIVDYLGNEMRRLKVEVNLAAPILLDDFQEIRGLADHVVVATGSRPADTPPELAGRSVFTVDQAVTGGVSSDAETVVVFDDGDGFWPAYNAAEAVAKLGRRVHFATSLTALGSRIPAESLGPLFDRLRAAGARFHIGQRLADVDGAVTLESTLTGEQIALPGAAVVWHRPRVPQSPFGPITNSVRLSVIGDCTSPRRIGHAISEGYAVGVSV